MDNENLKPNMDDFENDPRYEKAENFINDPRLLQFFKKALNDESHRELAFKNPEFFLSGYGIPLPEDLKIKFIKNPGEFKPIPNGSFDIRLTKCVTKWIADEPGQPPIQQTVCFGIEIVPFPILPVG